jgi:PHD/YefM family antitoxin component YafN of YafNO toxin-antitoxin module
MTSRSICGITRHGKPAGILIGFETEEDRLDCRLEHDPEFLQRIAEARAALRRGEGYALRVSPRSSPTA